MHSPMANGIISTKQNVMSKTSTRLEGATSELAAVGEGIISRLSTILEHKISVTSVAGNIVADSDLANFDKFSWRVGNLKD